MLSNYSVFQQFDRKHDVDTTSTTWPSSTEVAAPGRCTPVLSTDWVVSETSVTRQVEDLTTTNDNIFYLPLGFSSSKTEKSKKRSELEGEIRRYVTLPTGWDGMAAVTPTQQAANEALQFLDVLPPDLDLPTPMVEGDGEIAVYWKNNKGHLEVAFPGNGTINYWGEATDNSLEIEGDYSFDRKHIQTDLIGFIRFLSE